MATYIAETGFICINLYLNIFVKSLYKYFLFCLIMLITNANLSVNFSMNFYAIKTLFFVKLVCVLQIWTGYINIID